MPLFSKENHQHYWVLFFGLLISGCGDFSEENFFKPNSLKPSPSTSTPSKAAPTTQNSNIKNEVDGILKTESPMEFFLKFAGDNVQQLQKNLELFRERMTELKSSLRFTSEIKNFPQTSNAFDTHESFELAQLIVMNDFSTTEIALVYQNLSAFAEIFNEYRALSSKIDLSKIKNEYLAMILTMEMLYSWESRAIAQASPKNNEESLENALLNLKNDYQSFRRHFPDQSSLVAFQTALHSSKSFSEVDVGGALTSFLNASSSTTQPATTQPSLPRKAGTF